MADVEGLSAGAAEAGKVVYVGSIPYDQTEEQVLDIFRSVGPVANFRLVFDKETGKSKGFGFVEYHDKETAASAVRNLNNYQIGPRNIRVAFSHETSIADADDLVITGEAKMPTLPHGTPIPPGQSAAEAITATLNSFEQDRMLQVVTDIKSVINNNPALAVEMFKACPQLAYAAVQSLLILGMVDSDIIKDIVDQSQTQQPEQQPDQSALIQQVMQLTDEQIKELPSEQQEAVLSLRQKVQSGEIQV